MAETYRVIARVQKTHGRRGEVVAIAADGLPLMLEPGLVVHVVPPALKGPRSHRVTTVIGDDSSCLLTLEGVDSIRAAERLVGRYLLARAADLPAELLARDAHALLGRVVEDVRLGRVGEVKEVLRSPAQDVLVVEGPFGEVMVPYVDAFVREDSGVGAIVCELPDSLVGDASRAEGPGERP